jgi:chemotaxis protein CheD
VTQGALLSAPSDDGETRVHLLEGQFHISDNPSVVLTTTLGSCVATCLRDPSISIGGMNHFLLPGDDADAGEHREAARYGVYAMEVLINALLASGAKRGRLRAKLFGGGQLLEGLTNVGEQNVTFAEAFLAREGIPVCGGSVRGVHARKIQFWPAQGRARQFSLERGERQVFARELNRKGRGFDYGAVELF